MSGSIRSRTGLLAAFSVSRDEAAKTRHSTLRRLIQWIQNRLFGDLDEDKDILLLRLRLRRLIQWIQNRLFGDLDEEKDILLHIAVPAS